MKLSLAVVAALAACAPATAIRIITFTEAPVDNLHAFDNLPAHEVAAEHTPPSVSMRPCGKFRRPQPPRDPIAALLSKLGFGGDRQSERWMENEIAPDEGYFGAWKHRMEEFVRDAEDKVVPLLEGGVVNILPIEDLGQFGNEEPEHKHGWKHAHHHHHHEELHEEWSAPIFWNDPSESRPDHHHHHHKHAHAHHHHCKSFAARLRRAMLNLSPAEAITMSFVLGAGLGSILHFFFMIFLLSLRRLRCGRAGRSEQRAARREARRLRREQRNGGKQGAVRLEESDAEVLPAYAEGDERAQLVEKA